MATVTSLTLGGGTPDRRRGCRSAPLREPPDERQLSGIRYGCAALIGP